MSEVSGDFIFLERNDVQGRNEIYPEKKLTLGLEELAIERVTPEISPEIFIFTGSSADSLELQNQGI